MATTLMFQGMRGTGDWVTDQRPKAWREMILKLYPNGSVPLTAMLAKMRSEVVDDAEFNWWERLLPEQFSAISAGHAASNNHPVCVDSAGAPGPTAYAGSGVTGDVLHINLGSGADGLAEQEKYRVGHTATSLDSSYYDNHCVGKVTGLTQKAGASSTTWYYARVKLLEDDDNGGTVHYEDATHIMICGNINPELGDTPDPLAVDPVKVYNYTQIFRTSHGMSRTAMRTRLRTGDYVKQSKLDCLEMHSIEMEKAFWFSVPSETVGANGKIERSTGGALWFIYEKDGLTSHYKTHADYAADPWLTSGKTWMWKNVLEPVFRNGSREKVAYCGSGALLGIQMLIESGGNFDFTPMTAAYGIQVIRWVTPFGTIILKDHPLFTQNPALRYAMAIIDTKNLIYRYTKGDDTKYLPNRQGNGIDGELGEYLTEAGLEMHFGPTHMFCGGVGEDNILP